MIRTEAVRGRQDTPTAKSLIHSLGSNLSTLNLESDIIAHRMPSVLPGEQGVRIFVNSLTERGFTHLADAFSSVHAGEKRNRKGKQFPSERARREFELNSRIINDLRITVTENATLLDGTTQLNYTTFRQEALRNGEEVLSFYETFLESDTDISPATRQRAATLANQPGFQLSPLMESAFDNSSFGVAFNNFHNEIQARSFEIELSASDIVGETQGQIGFIRRSPVYLRSEAFSALDIEAANSGLSRTDVYNRAIAAYAYSSALFRAGFKEGFRDPIDGNLYNMRNALSDSPSLRYDLLEYLHEVESMSFDADAKTLETEQPYSIWLSPIRRSPEALIFSAAAALEIELEASRLPDTVIANNAVLYYCRSSAMKRKGYEIMLTDRTNKSTNPAPWF